MDHNSVYSLTAERMAQLSDNFKRVREMIAEAETKRGYGGVVLAAATKYALAEEINYAHRELGLSVIGENRVQALCDKYDTLANTLEIHLIGSLQTNKVKYITGKVSLIQSLDSVRLAKEIDSQSKKAGIKSRVLMEINIGREENKGGIMPEDASVMLDEFLAFENIEVCGVMTMAPLGEDDDGYRRYFTQTKEIFDNIVVPRINTDSPILSMGMSNSFLPAIECGATMVRVGSALFR